MNPDSTSEIELGTEEAPFKHLGLALLEIVNHASGKDVDVSIKVKAGTVNRFESGDFIAFKLKSFSITTYGGVERASLYIMDEIGKRS